jgi:predicted Zn-dependent protease
VGIGDVRAGSAAAGAEAAARCAASQGATDLVPDVYPVVLMPECLADLLAFLVEGFSAKSVQEGQSFFEPGRQLFDPALTLLDDVRAAGAIGLPFDTEGTERRPVPMIDGGRCAGLLHDRLTAAREAAEPGDASGPGTAGRRLPGGRGRAGSSGGSTGHAHLHSDAWGPAPAALHLLAGGTPSEQLVAGLERGVLVTCFNYSRVLDPKTMEVSGLTRNGTFWVEEGRVVRPLTNLRYTQSFLEALAPGRVEALGSTARYAESEWGPGLVRAPALRLSGGRFTGGAAG